MKKKPQTENTKKCLFCNNTHLTKEDYFPKWYQERLKKGTKRLYDDTIRVVDTLELDAQTGDIRKKAEPVKKPGDPRSRKIRCVCGPCNNGWMSQMQEAVKEIIIDISEHRLEVISPTQQDTLAKWAIMTTYVMEEHHRHLSCSTESQRISFKEDKAIPAGWNVWIGLYEGDLWSSFNHFGIKVLDRKSNDNPSAQAELGVQSTAWVIEKLFFLTSYININDFSLYDLERHKGIKSYPYSMRLMPLLQINSSKQEDIVLADKKALNDQEADFWSRFLLAIPAEDSRRAWEIEQNTYHRKIPTGVHIIGTKKRPPWA